MLDCGYKIYKIEGARALYSGILPALLRQSVYGTLKFGSYYTLKRIIVQQIDDMPGENLLINVTCATLAGAISSAIANPTDVLKVRMQISGKGTNKMGLARCFSELYRKEGIRGMYRGVVPTSQRASGI